MLERGLSLPLCLNENEFLVSLYILLWVIWHGITRKTPDTLVGSNIILISVHQMVNLTVRLTPIEVKFANVPQSLNLGLFVSQRPRRIWIHWGYCATWPIRWVQSFGLYKPITHLECAQCQPTKFQLQFKKPLKKHTHKLSHNGRGILQLKANESHGLKVKSLDWMQSTVVEWK